MRDRIIGALETGCRQNPLQFPEIKDGARRALVRDLPYGEFFTTGDNLITVLAVLHLRRHADAWKRRRRNTE